MNIKKIIALCGKAKVGKTTSIKEAYKALEKNFELKIIVPAKEFKDIFAVFEINGVIVGVCSAGDTEEIVDWQLAECLKKNCSLIICACRTRGGSYEKVIQYSKEHKYAIEFIDVPEISNKTKTILLGSIAHNLLLNVNWAEFDNV